MTNKFHQDLETESKVETETSHLSEPENWTFGCFINSHLSEGVKSVYFFGLEYKKSVKRQNIAFQSIVNILNLIPLNQQNKYWLSL